MKLSDPTIKNAKYGDAKNPLADGKGLNLYIMVSGKQRYGLAGFYSKHLAHRSALRLAKF